MGAWAGCWGSEFFWGCIRKMFWCLQPFSSFNLCNWWNKTCIYLNFQLTGINLSLTVSTLKLKVVPVSYTHSFYGTDCSGANHLSKPSVVCLCPHYGHAPLWLMSTQIFLPTVFKEQNMSSESVSQIQCCVFLRLLPWRWQATPMCRFQLHGTQERDQHGARHGQMETFPGARPSQLLLLFCNTIFT